MTMPERIWADTDLGCDDQGRWWDINPGGDAEGYVRADLVLALVDAAAAQLQYMDMCGDRGDLERNLRAALAAFKGDTP